MKKRYLAHSPALLALGAGIVGFGLRLWLFLTGVDAKGLLQPAHPGNLLSYLLAAVALAGIFWLTRWGYGTAGTGPAVFAGRFCAAVGFLWLGIDTLTQQAGVLELLIGLMSLPAAAAVGYTGWCRWKGRSAPVPLGCIIAVFLILYPISQYRLLSTHPQLQYYLFQVLAAVFLMLAAYQRALDIPGALCAFYSYGAIVLCLMSLADGKPVFYLSMALWLLADRPAAGHIMPLPIPVRYLLAKLKLAGYPAYVVGGCVRDHLMGLVPHDYDLCTAATPQQIAQVFRKNRLVRNGEKHGTVGVVVRHRLYELTTFRTEGDYSDSRHPDAVTFVTSLEEDLMRRDFTVNAMAYAPGKGIIDPWGGRQDLENRVLRAVGDPAQRFTEDALRILRGVRFATAFALVPEPETARAMVQLAPHMDKLARERVFDELCKLLPLVTARDLLQYEPIVLHTNPEPQACVGFDQHSPHHAYDVFTHTAHVVEAVPAVLSLRWAALLHDVEKPGCFSADEQGRGHFHGHAQTSARTADAVLRRLKAPNALREQAVWLIDHHMLPLPPDKKLLRRYLGKYGKDNLFALLDLQAADFGSKGTGTDQSPELGQTETLLEQLLEESACLTVADLAINGRDILALGHQPGPLIGQCISFLLDKVQQEMLPNEKKELLAAAQVFLDRNI